VDIRRRPVVDSSRFDCSRYFEGKGWSQVTGLFLGFSLGPGDLGRAAKGCSAATIVAWAQQFLKI
jgi:hypothetical protein